MFWNEIICRINPVTHLAGGAAKILDNGNPWVSFRPLAIL